jgi:hypothetical protein
LPEINQTPDELGAMSEKQKRFIMAKRQKILRTLGDKIIVYADGSIILGELIEMIARLLKRTAPRTTWEKKHADYITFAFDFVLI